MFVCVCVCVCVCVIGGIDYEASEYVFDLPENRRCHQVRIFDDNRPENEEVFDICIYTQSSLIAITTPCTQVHIIDNDSEYEKKLPLHF